MITIVKTTSELDALQDRWNELFELCSTATPYQTFLFNKITWEVWHEQTDSLYIICYSQSEGAKIDAIIPCYLNRNRELHLIDYLSDFCEGIIPDESIEKYAMYREIVNHILSDSKIKTVCFNNLRAGNRMLAYMYAFGGHSSIKTLTGYSVIKMTPTPTDKDFVDSIQSCNSSQRKKLRKQFKVASMLAFQEHKYPSEFPEQDVKSIANYMVDTQMRSKDYFTQRFFDYFRRLYENGMLTVLSHKKDSLPIAEKMFLTNPKANEYISWITLYRSKQDNSNLLLASLDMLYKTGVYNFNFARGIYAYKLSDFHPNIHILNQLVIHKSRHAALKYHLKEAAKQETDYLKQQLIIRLAHIKHKMHL